MNLQHIFDAPPTSPQAILQNRSDRVQRQNRLLSAGTECLVSFTLNIPGPVKQFPMARSAFQVGLSQVRAAFPDAITEERLVDLDTGSEALFSLSARPEIVKEALVSIEDYHPLGRLFDMDVLRSDGTPVSRQEMGFPPRTCLLCQQNAKICGRSRAHTMEALQLRVAQILNDFFRDSAANDCAACATRAILYEVSTTPKPGLVDRANSGSHHDMDFFTFLDSSAALPPWFREMFRIGWDQNDLPPRQLFQRLRFTGRQAEDAMFRATGGVNTHKGLVFSLGILCCALGVVSSRKPAPVPMQDLIAVCKSLGSCSLGDFSQKALTGTHGLSCYHNLGLSGVRGEAAQGFPAAFEVALPALLHGIRENLSINDSAAIALLHLVASVQDTNMVARSSLEEANSRQEEALRLLRTCPPRELLSHLKQLDDDYISRNLSPGGCADLLSIALMLLFLYQGSHLSLSAEMTSNSRIPDGSQSSCSGA